MAAQLPPNSPKSPIEKLGLEVSRAGDVTRANYDGSTTINQPVQTTTKKKRRQKKNTKSAPDVESGTFPVAVVEESVSVREEVEFGNAIERLIIEPIEWDCGRSETAGNDEGKTGESLKKISDTTGDGASATHSDAVSPTDQPVMTNQLKSVQTEKKNRRKNKKKINSAPDVESGCFPAVAVEESVSVHEQVELGNAVERLTIEPIEWGCERSETAGNDEGKTGESVKKNRDIAGEGAGVTHSDAITPKNRRRSKKKTNSAPDADSGSFPVVAVEDSVSINEEVEPQHAIQIGSVKLTIEQIEWDHGRSETSGNGEEGKSVDSLEKDSIVTSGTKSAPDVDSGFFPAVVVEESVSVHEEVQLGNAIERLIIEPIEWGCGRSEAAGNDEGKTGESLKKVRDTAGDGATVAHSDSITPKNRSRKKKTNSAPDVDSGSFPVVAVEESVSINEEVEPQHAIQIGSVKLTIEQIEWDHGRSETSGNGEEGKSVDSLENDSIVTSAGASVVLSDAVIPTDRPVMANQFKSVQTEEYRRRKKNGKSATAVENGNLQVAVVQENVTVEEDMELRNSNDRSFVKLTIEQIEWDCGRSETAGIGEEGQSVDSLGKDSIVPGDAASVTHSDAFIPTDENKSVQKEKRRRRKKKNTKSATDVESGTLQAVVVEESVSIAEEVKLENSNNKDFFKSIIEQIEWDSGRPETANSNEGRSVESLEKDSVDGNDKERFEDERVHDEGEVGKSGHAVANLGGNNQNDNQRRVRHSMKADTEDCRLFMKFGSCKIGSQCKFNHPPQRRNQGVQEKANRREEKSEKHGRIECKVFSHHRNNGTTGGHKYGKDCKHSHGSDKSSTSHSPKFNFMGLPIRPGEKECPDYMQTGSCKYGPNCRLHHPEPTSVDGANSSGHDSGGTPPPQFGSLSPVSPWSSPRDFNEPSPFVPKMFSSAQNAPSSNPEWTGYQAGRHSPSSGKSLPIPPAFAMNNILATEIQFPPQYQSGTVAEGCPEHPGEPECSIFMKMGDCKSRSNCKFHHPRNNISKPKANSHSLNDKGLPFRNDQPLCAHDHSNGLGFSEGETDFLEKKKSRMKSRRKISSPEEDDVHGDTHTSRKSADHVDPSRSGMLHEGQVGCCSSEVWKSPLSGTCEDRATTTSTDGKDDFIVTYFNSNVASLGVNETCRKHVKCHCLFVEGSECNEREVAILLSSEQKLYIVAVDTCHGSETHLKTVGSHRVGDVKQIFVGLGLQVIRVCFEGNATYLLITRCMERASDLLSLLSISDSSGMKNYCPLMSLEQMQLNCFVEQVCGGSRINLFQYSMVLFCPKHVTELCDKLIENMWLPRSLFVLEGYLLLCTEKLMQFGLSANAFSPQYLLLDSCCAISDVCKMVIETQDSPCITLTLKGTSEFRPSEKAPTTQRSAFLKKKSASDPTVWKLKWFSADGLCNFIALMKAIHQGVNSSPLLLEYPS